MNIHKKIWILKNDHDSGKVCKLPDIKMYFITSSEDGAVVPPDGHKIIPGLIHKVASQITLSNFFDIKHYWGELQTHNLYEIVK